jgi:hypothetical protein
MRASNPQKPKVETKIETRIEDVPEKNAGSLEQGDERGFNEELDDTFEEDSFDPDDGAREWEPLNDEEFGDPDPPVDLRWSLGSKVCEEVFNSRYPLGKNTAGLLEVFVKARLSCSARVMRGSPRRFAAAPRVVQLAPGGRCAR